MASQLKVDSLTGVTTAGSISVTGEGNSTTTNLQQGLVKAWGNSNAAGTSVYNSFNVTSLTDNDTGQQFFNITNVYSAAAMGGGTAQTSVGNEFIASSNTTSQVRIYAFDGSSYQDQSVTWNMCGDLA